MNSSDSECVRVFIKVRPSTSASASTRVCPLTIDTVAGSIDYPSSATPQRFQFDGVSGPATSQEELFQSVGVQMTEKVLQGYNGSIFAYGQTGSGKTYSMQGPILGGSAAGVINSSSGLMPRAFNFLFDRISAQTSATLTFSVECSFLEIYNEKIWDLLAESEKHLQLREDIKGASFVEGLTLQRVTSASDCESWLNRGALNRRVGETAMNRESSRSHSVFQLAIKSQETRADGRVIEKFSRYSLIDLAGSERQRDLIKGGEAAAAGERLKESANINKSLSSLALVIRALVDVAQGKDRHIHYRDSKLTHLLRDSLGGNSLCCILACIANTPESISESISTLQFASRAKKMKNSAKINESQQLAKMEELQNENKKLLTIIAAIEKMQGKNENQTTNEENGKIPELTEEEKLENANLLAMALARESDWLAANNRLENLLKAQELLTRAAEKRSSALELMMKMREKTVETLADRVRKSFGNLKSDAPSSVERLESTVEILEDLIRQQNSIAFPPDLTREVLIRSQSLAIAKLQERINSLDHSISQADDSLDSHNSNCHRLQFSSHLLTIQLLSAESQRDLIQAELNSVKGKWKERESEAQTLRLEFDRGIEFLRSENQALKLANQNNKEIYENEKILFYKKLNEITNNNNNNNSNENNNNQNNHNQNIEININNNNEIEINRLKSELESRTLELSQLRDDTDSLRLQIRVCEDESAAAQNNLKLSDQRIAELQSRVAIVESERDEAINQLETARFELDSLSEDHEILITEMNERKAEEEKPQAETNESRNEEDERLYQQQIAENARLKEINGELGLAVKSLSQSLQEFQLRADESKLEIRELQSVIGSMRSENSRLLASNASLVGHSNPKQKILGLVRIKNENESLKGEKEALEKELRKLKIRTQTANTTATATGKENQMPIGLGLAIGAIDGAAGEGIME